MVPWDGIKRVRGVLMWEVVKAIQHLKKKSRRRGGTAGRGGEAGRAGAGIKKSHVSCHTIVLIGGLGTIPHDTVPSAPLESCLHYRELYSTTINLFANYRIILSCLYFHDALTVLSFFQASTHM